GIYESLLTAINKKKTLTKKQKLLEKRFHGQHIGINEKPPYALSFYDSMLAEESAVRQQSETARLEIKLSKKSRLDAESKLDSLEKRFCAASAIKWMEKNLKIKSTTTLIKRGLDSTYKAVLNKTHRALLK
ncbi:MAG: hypothetical protein JJW03_01520, partial [Desulfosarcina sp.]|nr:hypothetical protein [Desulfobacterales bacterium]